MLEIKRKCLTILLVSSKTSSVQTKVVVAYVNLEHLSTSCIKKKKKKKINNWPSNIINRIATLRSHLVSADLQIYACMHQVLTTNLVGSAPLLIAGSCC